jgi:hypothetical protein
MKKLIGILLLALLLSMPAHASYRLWQHFTTRFNVDAGICNLTKLQFPNMNAQTTLVFEAYGHWSRSAKCWFFSGGLAENEVQTFSMNGYGDSLYGNFYVEGYSDITEPSQFTITTECNLDIQIVGWQGMNYRGNRYSSSAHETRSLTLNTHPSDLMSARIRLYHWPQARWERFVNIHPCAGAARR